ncbi:hexose kinase [Paenarthrobacter sp. PH39-S1]|uniref:1-phosphofructokinase family hexose kinase n=1 Tax=Paenarthrobacter sp. PH39-S1 TaxID=3046204 RepID=UPI0024B8CC65|nr:hexose kinase [Paenarthrobacter sp. PH39-S1]MDJ0357759.1 hexose kinase [Paenarthrobacter sp. PH39-S1]
MTGSVVTVTPNPALDITYTVAGLRPGGSHRVPAPLTRAGGKGVNVSRVAHQLGCPTLVISTAGGGTGAEFAADLRNSGIPNRLIPVTAQTRRTIALVDTGADLTSIFNEEGPALSASEWQRLVAAVVESLATAGVLVGSGSLPENAPADFYPALVELAHRAGVPAIIDTSGAGILAAAKAGADLLKPNNDELTEAMGERDLVTAALRLLEMGARRVLVSAGAEGMLAFDAGTPGRYLCARLPEPLRGNPTGAGDAAVSAAAVALAAGITDLEEILRRATAWSAAAVLMPAAGEISPRHQELAGQLIIRRY